MALRLDFIITDSGFTRLGRYLAADSTGPLAFVSLGDAGYANASGYVPDVTRTALVREQLRIPVLSGEVYALTAAVQVSIAAMATAPTNFWSNEIGLHFADGTLFAIASKPAGFFFVNAGEERLVTVETGFTNIPVGSLTLVETAPSFAIFNTLDSLNYTIAVTNMAAWNFNIEADAAIARINALWR